MTVDEMIEALAPARRAKVRQRILALIDQENKLAPDLKNVVLLKKVREIQRNGR
jgi:hypothetical protein